MLRPVKTYFYMMLCSGTSNIPAKKEVELAVIC